MEPAKQQRSGWASAGEYMGLAMVIPATTFAGYALGWGVDRWLGTGWAWMVGAGLGCGAGFREILRRAEQLEKRDRDANNSHSSGR